MTIRLTRKLALFNPPGTLLTTLLLALAVPTQAGDAPPADLAAPAPQETATDQVDNGLKRASLKQGDLASTASGDNEFLPVDDAFELSINLDGDTATLVWVIAPDYYLYRHAFSVAIDSETAVQPLTEQVEFSQGIRKIDDYFGPVEAYYYQATGKLPLTAIESAAIEASHPQTNPITLTVKYQGCADAGLCYPIQVKQLVLASQTAPGQSNSENLPDNTATKLKTKLP